jgi:general secretion pathway protein D
MTQRRTISLFGIVAGLFLCVPLLTAEPLITAVSAMVRPGDVFTVPVTITGASDVFAFQFDLAFDPAILELQSISEGGFLPTAGATIFAPGTIDNTAGTATATADTLSGAVPGASGSGTLADFTFRALALGTSDLALSNVILLDSSLSDIPFTTGFAGVHVVVPEPAGLAWVGALALAAALRLRKAA